MAVARSVEIEAAGGTQPGAGEVSVQCQAAGGGENIDGRPACLIDVEVRGERIVAGYVFDVRRPAGIGGVTRLEVDRRHGRNSDSSGNLQFAGLVRIAVADGDAAGPQCARMHDQKRAPPLSVIVVPPLYVLGPASACVPTPVLTRAKLPLPLEIVPENVPDSPAAPTVNVVAAGVASGHRAAAGQECNGFGLRPRPAVAARMSSTPPD